MIDAAFFARYDAMGAEEGSLAGVEAHLASANKVFMTEPVLRDDLHSEPADIVFEPPPRAQALADGRARLAAATQRLQGNLAKQRERQERIKACETGFFKGTTLLQPQLWFKGGVEAEYYELKDFLYLNPTVSGIATA